LHPIARELVKIGRVMVGATITMQVVDSEIITKNEQDIRWSGCISRLRLVLSANYRSQKRRQDAAKWNELAKSHLQ
jgi:hypothetical protein